MSLDANNYPTAKDWHVDHLIDFGENPQKMSEECSFVALGIFSTFESLHLVFTLMLGILLVYDRLTGLIIVEISCIHY